MFPDMTLWLKLLLAAGTSFLISFLMTPPVKNFAEHVGAIDVPKDDRRIHTRPIPRMGGLAIFMGFIVSCLIFADASAPLMGMMVGALIIAVMGAVDDIVALNAWVKLAAQIFAAVVAIRGGIYLDAVSNPNILSDQGIIFIGRNVSYFLTLLWIVGCTNAVNLIDGLDGLAVGVSAISSITMLVVALFVSEPVVSVILACLAGACIGFMPYNMNPAKIFMGDVGSQLLGYVLATVSIMGLFKFHTVITFFVPVMAMLVPLADTVFAFTRRILRGQSPFHADKGHFHHRLLALGLSQKQVAAVLYAVSAFMGIFAVLLAGEGRLVRIICLVLMFIVSLCVWLFIFRKMPKRLPAHKDEEE